MAVSCTSLSCRTSGRGSANGGGGHSALSLVFVVVVLVCVESLLPIAVATDHIVGANRGWQPPGDVPDNKLNYTQWVASQQFFLDDYISFHYQEGLHTVYQVNYSTYVNCTFSPYYGHDYIYNWSTKGGRSYVPLNKTGMYYFACGFHCQQGMKLAVEVKLNTTANTTSQPSSITSNGSTTANDGGNSSNSNTVRLHVAAASLAVALIFVSVSLLLGT